MLFFGFFECSLNCTQTNRPHTAHLNSNERRHIAGAARDSPGIARWCAADNSGDVRRGVRQQGLGHAELCVACDLHELTEAGSSAERARQFFRTEDANGVAVGRANGYCGKQTKIVSCERDDRAASR